MKEFHIVCEGVTDCEVLKAVTSEISRTSGLKMRVKALFPSTRQVNAGWGNLKNWCLNQSSALAGNNQRQLAAAALGAKPTKAVALPRDKISAALALTHGIRSFLVVQLDTDIAEFLGPDVGLQGQHILPLNPASRLRICERALDSWLGGHIGKKGTAIFYCLTSLSLENWLLASHDKASITSVARHTSAFLHYDEIHFPEEILIRLGYKADTPTKLKKTAAKYKEYGQRLANSLALGRRRSPSLDKYCSMLVSA